MKKAMTSRVFCCLLSLVCLLSVLTLPTYAEDMQPNQIEENTYILPLGTIRIPNVSEDGTTTRGFQISNVECALIGNTGSIRNLYTVQIRWEGNASIGWMQASNLKIKHSSVFSTFDPFFDRGFYMECGGAMKGTLTIGSCYIPEEVKGVIVSATGLQAYVNNSPSWISLSGYPGYIAVNQ